MGASETKRRIIKPSTERRALLEILLKKRNRGAASNRRAAIRPRATAGPSPLSFNEERLWYLDRFQPDGPSANLHAAVRIHHELMLDVLRQAVTDVVNRHEALRTTYAEESGAPVRVIADQGQVTVSFKDLSTLDEVTRATQTEELLLGEAQKRVDLQPAPLARFLVLRLAEDDYVLSVAIHPIISDGASLRVLIGETLLGYDALRRGQLSPLAELSLQYPDFAAWQRSTDRAVEFEEHLDYWREKLGDGVSEWRIESQRGSNPKQTPAQFYQGTTRSLTISAPRLRALTAACQNNEATLFMILAAALEQLLHECSGQTDFLVGVLASHRGRVGMENVIGSFGNTLPLRADLSGDPSFSQLLGRVRQTSLDAFTHLDLPYDRLLEEIPLPPLRAVLLVPEALTSVAPGDLQLTPLPLRNQFALYDLQLSCLEVGEQLIVSLHHRTSLFDESAADAMLERFDRLLAVAVEEPDRPLRSLGQAVKLRHQAGRDSAADTASANRHVTTPAQTPLETQLVSLWETALRVSPIGIDDDFFELGGHSLVAIRLFTLIEKVLGKRLPLSSLIETPTIRKMAGLLLRAGWSPRWTSLVPIQPAGRKPPLYCVHGAGGNILFLHELARVLGNDQPIYGFQAVGLEGITSPLQSVEAMAAHYVREMKTIQPHGPYYLGGYCFGAYAALEMARQLEESGETVAFLGVFNEAGGWRMLGAAEEGVGLHITTLRRLEWGQRIAYLRERALYRVGRIVSSLGAVVVWGAGRIYGGLNRGALPRGFAYMLVERSTHEAGMRYQPPRYAGFLALFQARTLALPAAGSIWHSISDGTVETHEMQHDEASMFTQPGVNDLAERLSASLERARIRFQNAHEVSPMHSAETPSALKT